MGDEGGWIVECIVECGGDNRQGGGIGDVERGDVNRVLNDQLRTGSDYLDQVQV